MGDEVVIGKASAHMLETLRATVARIRPTFIQLSTPECVLFATRGTALLLRPPGDTDIVGWAKLLGIKTTPEESVLRLAPPRWESMPASRASRVETEARVVASFVERSGPRRTVGQAINYSATGARVRVRTPLPLRALVHLAFYNRCEEPIVAIAQVSRIVEGTEASSGGFEVGLTFVRFIRGKQRFEQLTGQKIRASAS